MNGQTGLPQKVMHEIPARMNQPADTDEPIGVQGPQGDCRADHGIDQFPQTESATQVRTARAREDDRVERATGRFGDVVLGDLSTACEVFGLATGKDGRSAYEVRVCSESVNVESMHVALRVPWRLSSLARADTVIVPGVSDLNRPLPASIVRAIWQAVHRGARVASICTGAFVLAGTGILDGLRATTHWRAAGELARRYPRIEVDANVLYVDNGRVLTSAGAAAGFDLCIHLVRCDLGAEAAAAVARLAVMPPTREGGQAQFIRHEPSSDAPGSMAALLTWIEQNLQKELPLSAIARRAAMSTRTLSRCFHEQIGATPAAWVARARVRRAQRLLETTDLAVEQVATDAGFGSAAVMREHFGTIVGTSPLSYRRAFSRVGRSGIAQPSTGTAKPDSRRDGS
jgi:transcriptional regulator GlxA family with amidase domain